jgi:iron complex outermembrane receptor protein
LGAPWQVATKYDVVTGQAEYRFAGQKLTYVGSYANQKIHSPATTDTANMLPAGEAAYRDTRTQQSQTSHELRIASEERVAGLFDYTAGLFYSLEKPDVYLNFPASYLSGAFGSPLGLPDPFALDGRYLIHALTESHGRREERSAFGSLTWHIDDRTELTGGGRYIISKDDELTNVSLSSDGLIALPAAVALPPGVSCSVAGLASTYPGTCDFPSSLAVSSAQLIDVTANKRWTPKVYSVSLSHRFTDEFLAYLNYGTAWRRGPTAVGIQNATNDPVLNRFVFIQPETSKAWELGFKSTFLDNRARVNLAVYRQTYEGFIYLTPLVTYLGDSGAGASPQAFQFTTNVPAIVKGADLDTSFQLTSRWNMGMAFSYADGHMQDATVPCNGPIPAGQHVALCGTNNSVTTAPTWNANWQSEYSTPVTSSIDGYVRGLFNYYPRNDRASGQGTGFTAASYGILNLYLGLRNPGGAWDVQLFARNLTNTQRTLTYEQSPETDPISPVSLNFGQSGYYRTSATPLREFGLTARYAFGPH